MQCLMKNVSMRRIHHKTQQGAEKSFMDTRPQYFGQHRPTILLSLHNYTCDL